MQFFRMDPLLIFVLYKSLLKMKDMVVILKIENLLNLSLLSNSSFTYAVSTLLPLTASNPLGI